MPFLIVTGGTSYNSFHRQSRKQQKRLRRAFTLVYCIKKILQVVSLEISQTPIICLLPK